VVAEHRRIPNRYLMGAESQITSERMLEHGVNNVRGAGYCRVRDLTTDDLDGLVSFLGHYNQLDYDELSRELVEVLPRPGGVDTAGSSGIGSGGNSKKKKKKKKKKNRAPSSNNDADPAGGGQDEDEADGGRLDDGSEDAVVVDAELLGVAVGDEPRLELLDGGIAEALDIEDVVAVHQIAATGNF
jgi:hypothetical protein